MLGPARLLVFLPRWTALVLFWSWFFFLIYVASDRYDRGEWSGEVAYLVALGGGLAAPIVVAWLLTRAACPLVQARMRVLGDERKQCIEERGQFYASPEWKALRERVIAEDGPTCVICGWAMGLDADVTVDHIRPRSSHPEHSLVRSNLQVLCRRCNSSKGSREMAAS